MPSRVANLLALSLSALGIAPGALAGHGPNLGTMSSDPTGISITPISGPLGLADIGIDEPAGTVTSGAVRLPDGTEAPMLLETRSGRRRLVARVKTGLPRFEITVQVAPGNGSVRTIGPVQVEAEPDPDHRTPDWAKGTVWYQIFVDRFRNGREANDSQRSKAGVRPWNEPWESLSHDELEQAWAAMGDAVAAGSADAIGQHSAGALVRHTKRYGGDLAGVAEKLPYLKDLGIEAIYLTPIFEARSSHKYDATDYRHIDRSFAGAGEPFEAPGETADPATWKLSPADRDFREQFLPAVHAAGMRVILDGVWNHVGREFWAFKDIVARGKDSPYAGWFDALYATGDQEIDRARYEPGALIGWRGWNRRNGELPIFARRDGNLVPPVQEHVFNVTRRWMNAPGPRKQRIDGWRLDVAPDVPRAFWKQWRGLVKSIDAEALLIGEVWFQAGAFFGGEAFDGQMNYPLAVPIVRFICGDTEMPSGALAATIGEVCSNHPATDLVQLNLLGSHDTARLATMVQDPGAGYEQLPRSTQRWDRRRRPSGEAYQRVLLGVALQATLPGSPMVYYGDEVGVFGGNDPDCRKPFPWEDRGPYPAGSAGDQALRDQFARWLNLRKHPQIGEVLRYGSLHLEAASAGPGQEGGAVRPDVLVFRRALNASQVLVAVNRGDKPFDASTLACWGQGWASVTGGDPRMVPARGAAVWSLEGAVKVGK